MTYTFSEAKEMIDKMDDYRTHSILFQVLASERFRYPAHEWWAILSRLRARNVLLHERNAREFQKRIKDL